jgi:glycosyltransferase involved in cell wall biosynthesis
LRALLGGNPPRYPLYLTEAAQRQFARETEAAIRAHRPDAILSISSHCLLYLSDPGVPVFMVSDAPWMTWKETYREFEKMPVRGRRFAELEAQAARRCTKVIFSSKWATDEARRLYGVGPEKVCAQPMGANWTPTESSEELAQIIQSRDQDELRLLFVGKDWERKGGPLTLEVVRTLRSERSNVRLHIVGGNPDIPADLQDIVTVHGLLRRGDSIESEKLRQLFLTSHFLIVPTLAECFGVVFAEAHAFCLPAVSRNIHAVPSIIQDGKTGLVLGKNDPVSTYVERILTVAKDRETYLKMAFAARARYEAHLNWQSFAETIVDQMRLAVEQGASAMR